MAKKNNKPAVTPANTLTDPPPAQQAGGGPVPPVEATKEEQSAATSEVSPETAESGRGTAETDVAAAEGINDGAAGGEGQDTGNLGEASQTGEGGEGGDAAGDGSGVEGSGEGEDKEAESEQEEIKPVETKQAGPLNLTISTGEALVVSSSKTNPEIDTRLVKVRISYPEDYTGTKYIPEGEEREVSPETAEVLIAKGIASKVE